MTPMADGDVKTEDLLWTRRQSTARPWGGWRKHWHSVCGADHPRRGLEAAAESGTERDIKNARTLFPQIEAERPAGALAMLED